MGAAHCSVDSSSPTICRPGFESQAPRLCFFQLKSTCILYFSYCQFGYNFCLHLYTIYRCTQNIGTHPCTIYVADTTIWIYVAPKRPKTIVQSG